MRGHPEHQRDRFGQGADHGPKLNMSNMSEMAGPFVGTYGFAAAVVGFGKLSRLRFETGGSDQLRSTNFSSDA
jgi:hypothetical protein